MESERYGESEQVDENRNAVPIRDLRIGTLIRALNDEAKRTSVRSLAERAGISQSAARKYLKGISYPDAPVLLRIADALGSNVGELFGEIPAGIREESASYTAAANDSDFVAIPRYNVEVAAGHGSLVAEEQEMPPLQFRRDWISQEGWKVKDLVLVTGRGDSLPGLVDDGRPVLVDRSQTSIASDGVYVARLDGHLIVKLMQRGPGGRIYLRSTNPDFREIELRPEDQADFEVIGRAVWSDRRL